MRINPYCTLLERPFMTSVGLSTETAHHLKVYYLRQLPSRDEQCRYDGVK